MPRLAVVEPASSEALKGVPPINIFKGVANDPAILGGFLAFNGAVKASGAFNEQEMETVVLAAVQAFDCHYCLAAHTMLGQKAGLSGEDIISIRKGKSSDPRRSALATFTKRVIETKGFVSDADIAAFRKAGFGDRQMIAVVALVSISTFTAFFNHVNDTAIDFPPAPEL